MKVERLWTKNFILVSTINATLTFVFYLLIVIIGVYATNTFDATVSQAGLITGIFIIGTLLGRLFTGYFIDSFGHRKTLITGLILLIFTSMLYFVQAGILLLILARFIHGMALGVASTATGTIVAQVIPRSRSAEGIGYYSMSSTISTAIGPFIGLFMMHHTGFQLIFALCTSLSVIGLILALLLRIQPVTSHRKKREKLFAFSHFIEVKSLPISVVALLWSFCYSSVLSFMNAYALELDLVKAASFFFVVYSVAIFISRPFTGRLLDNKGANIVMYPAILLFSAGLFVLGFAKGSIALLLAGILLGFGFGNIQSSAQAIAVLAASPKRIGLATSTFYIFLDAGLGFGPYILGLIIPFTGYANMYLVLGGLTLFTLLVYENLHGRKARKARKTSMYSADV